MDPLQGSGDLLAPESGGPRGMKVTGRRVSGARELRKGKSTGDSARLLQRLQQEAAQEALGALESAKQTPSVRTSLCICRTAFLRPQRLLNRRGARQTVPNPLLQEKPLLVRSGCKCTIRGVINVVELLKMQESPGTVP